MFFCIFFAATDFFPHLIIFKSKKVSSFLHTFLAWDNFCFLLGEDLDMIKKSIFEYFFGDTSKNFTYRAEFIGIM